MGEIRYNKSIVKNINESLIRRMLQGAGTFTKTKVARETGLSFPTVSRILDEMAESGEILGGGVDPTTGGRHAQSYVLNPEYAYVQCIYFLNARTMRSLLINAVGEKALEEDIRITDLKAAVEEGIDQCIEKNLAKFPIKAISIGLPWGVSQGKILFGAKPFDLENYPIEDHLKEKFGISARVENDMNSVAAGCYARMFGRDERVSLACLSVAGGGCGCGLFVRGHLVRGRHGFAGELRYLAEDPEKNMENIFTNGKLIKAPVGYVSQMLASVCAVVDPAYVVFYQRPDVPFDLAEVKEACRRFLPEDVVPELLVSDTFNEDLENGLIGFGSELLLQGYEIVNR